MAQSRQERKCLDCGSTFTGHKRARYCPACLELRRGGTTYEVAQSNKPGFFSRIANVFEPIKHHLTYMRLLILTVICLAVGIGMVFYLKSQPYSVSLVQRIEAVSASNMAFMILIFAGTALHVLRWRKVNGKDAQDAEYWEKNYWKQLLAWLIGLVIVEVSSFAFVIF